MKPSDKKQAIEIISNNNSCNVSFNVPVKNNYSNVYDILLHETNASLINELIKAGFSLSMNKKGLAVDKY